MKDIHVKFTSDEESKPTVKEFKVAPSERKVRVWKFDKEDEPGNPLIVDEGGLSAILDELKNSDVGDRYTIRIEDMPEEQFNALPEWDHW